MWKLGSVRLLLVLADKDIDVDMPLASVVTPCLLSPFCFSSYDCGHEGPPYEPSKTTGLSYNNFVYCVFLKTTCLSTYFQDGAVVRD